MEENNDNGLIAIAGKPKGITILSPEIIGRPKMSGEIRSIHKGYVFIGNAVEVFHERSKAVSMSGYDNFFPGFYDRRYRFMPIW